MFAHHGRVEMATRARTTKNKRKTKNRCCDVLSRVPDGIFETDIHGYCVFVNPPWLEIVGLTRDEAIGKHWNPVHPHAVVHPEDCERLQAQWEQALAKKEAFECECRYRSKSGGTYRWYLVRMIPACDARGEVERWLGSTTDIDDLKQSQRELQDLVDNHEEILSIASHELKAPLTSLHLKLQLLCRALQADGEPAVPPRAAGKPWSVEKLAKTAESCLGQSRKLAKLLDGLLDLTRLRFGKLHLLPQTADLAQLVSDVVARTRSETPEARSRISIETRGPIMGEWDPVRIDQIVTNLLSNAVKYGEGKPIAVVVEADAERGLARIIVQDHGMGIPTQMREKIFDRFERACSGAQISGLGLGLYIVRQIVEAQVGSIRLESEVGKGSTFTVELPMQGQPASLAS